MCWACGTSHDGKPDPDFEVATAPIEEVHDASPPPPWLAALMVLFFPAALFYGLIKLLFPIIERRLQFTLASLFFWITLSR